MVNGQRKKKKIKDWVIGYMMLMTCYIALYRLKSVNNSASLKLKKVYFFWICPDTNAFEWFSTLLDSIDTHFTEQGKPDFLKYYIYLSRGWNNTQVGQSSHQDNYVPTDKDNYHRQLPPDNYPDINPR